LPWLIFEFIAIEEFFKFSRLKSFVFLRWRALLVVVMRASAAFYTFFSLLIFSLFYKFFAFSYKFFAFSENASESEDT